MEKDAENKLEGFDWEHTQDPVTSGVLIWPEIFKVSLRIPEDKVASLFPGLSYVEIMNGTRQLIRVFCR